MFREREYKRTKRVSKAVVLATAKLGTVFVTEGPVQLTFDGRAVDFQQGKAGPQVKVTNK